MLPDCDIGRDGNHDCESFLEGGIFLEFAASFYSRATPHCLTVLYMEFLLYRKADDDKGRVLEATLQAFTQSHPHIHLTCTIPLVVTPSLLPCLLIKNEATVLLQLMKPYQMFGGEKMSVESVAYVLGKYGVVPEEVKEDPRGYPYNVDELLNFPMTVSVPDPIDAPLGSAPSELADTGSLGERIHAAVQRVFDHPIAQQMH